jgi:hypothetical protein
MAMSKSVLLLFAECHHNHHHYPSPTAVLSSASNATNAVSNAMPLSSSSSPYSDRTVRLQGFTAGWAVFVTPKPESIKSRLRTYAAADESIENIT